MKKRLQVNSDPWTSQTTHLTPSQLRPQTQTLPIHTPLDSDHPNSDHFGFNPSHPRPLDNSDP